MLLQYWNAHGAGIDSQRSDASSIQKQLYSRKARGIHASDMESYLKASGFRVFPLNGDWKDLLEQLKQGRPLIASLQPGRAKNPATLRGGTGIDWQSGAVFINDPARGETPPDRARGFRKAMAGKPQLDAAGSPRKAS